MPSTAWPGVQSKVIELTHLTRVVQDAKLCMVWGAIKLSHLTQDAKRFMALGAIEGNRTHPFDLGSAGCQPMHGLRCNRRQWNSPDCLG